ncbi:MAG: hypothetical protein KIT16_18110, partial [Rhodospirillaceae bacterium]|nr:hypothetical protein [Rhodospirillaceae bacterium]
KAETEFNQTIEAESSSFDALSPKPADTSGVTRDMPDFYSSFGSDSPKLQPLMDHQRKKKPAKRTARPVYKARLLTPPAPRSGAETVRRKVRI